MRRDFKREKQIAKFLAKTLSTVFLLFAFLQNVVPLSFLTVSAANELCVLVLLPHVARAFGFVVSRDAYHLKPKRSSRSTALRFGEETICGAKALLTRIERKVRANKNQILAVKSSIPYDECVDKTANSQTAPPAVDVSNLHQPCRPDCGAPTFGFGKQNRSCDKTTALSFNLRPNPPSAVRVGYYRQLQIFVSHFFRRDSQSRAPPVSFF